MYLPRLPARSADIYTVRIFNPSTRPSSLASLKSAVRREGGSVVVDLMDGKGFMYVSLHSTPILSNISKRACINNNRFSMPPGSHDPLTGYQHGRLLEEGCIQVTKTTLEKENWRRSVGSSDDDGEVENEEDRRPRSGNGKEHENLRLQWRWTEVKR